MKLLEIGWEEWCSFPELGIEKLKFKTDTGATTSTLHATDIEIFIENGVEYAKFKTQPLQGRKAEFFECIAPVSRRKTVTSSNGMKERRIVIRTLLELGQRKWSVELTLTSRKKMKYRMLLGREAMARMIIYPRKSFLLGRK